MSEAVSVLSAQGLTVRFGGHLAVNHVDVDVAAGTITGLIGPNGAGKTTIFNALCGMQELTNGRIRLDGSDITALPTHKRARLGLARTFQRLELFGSLTTRENLQVAAEHRAKGSDRDGDSARRVADAIDYVGLTAIADRRADTLSTGQARLVELARALVTQPRVLLLDEPASGLDASETRDLTEILRGLAESGVAILLVEHDMPLVMSTCSVVHVIDFGSLLAVGSPEEIRSNQAVLDAYLGTSEVSV
jgi:branched-chain amino acid transport system ATP-binding protein